MSAHAMSLPPPGRGIKLCNQAELNRAKAAEQAQALRPHIECCIEAGRTLSSAIATAARHRATHGSQWFSTPAHRARHRLGL